MLKFDDLLDRKEKIAVVGLGYVGLPLAVHLSKELAQEVEVAAIFGTVAVYLMGALTEMEAVAQGTRCHQPHFSISINPPCELSREQYEESTTGFRRAHS